MQNYAASEEKHKPTWRGREEEEIEANKQSHESTLMSRYPLNKYRVFPSDILSNTWGTRRQTIIFLISFRYLFVQSLGKKRIGKWRASLGRGCC